MGNKNNKTGFPYRIESRISTDKYEELVDLLSKCQNQTMSSLIRKIICNQKVKLIHYDQTQDLLMEKLSGIQSELKRIGVNVNQLTTYFNKSGDLGNKISSLRKVADLQQLLINKQDELNRLLEPVVKKWLQG